MKKISENFESNKKTETIINSDFNSDNNCYKNDSISYNNQGDSVAVLEATTKVTTEELKQGKIC
jgi:hypothetical protein